MVTAIVNTGLTWFIYNRNRASNSNRIFAFFVAFIAFWALIILLFRLTASQSLALVLMNLSYVSALLLAYFYYRFSNLFPREEVEDRTRLRAIQVVTALVAGVILFPGMLTTDVVFHEWGKEVILRPFAYYIFAFSFIFYFVGGTLRLFIKIPRHSGIERLQLWIVSVTVITAGIFGMYFNLYLPSPFFQNFKYIWSGPIFTFFFAVVITYSIFRFKLFNPRAILAEALVYLLLLFLFVRLILTDTLTDLVINGTLLAVVSIVGGLLIRSVTKEVEQREEIEKQERELQIANQRQESLIHFISHEVKGYLTKSEAAFSAIANGDFGETTPEIKNVSTMALAEMRKGASTVTDILDASNLKKGTLSFKNEPFNLIEAVEQVLNDLRPAAEEKGLKFVYHKPVTGVWTFVGDKEKLQRHVFRNIIDNSIKYTPSGSITVDLVRDSNTFRIIVSDTGVGITPEDMKNLFTEGGHGKDSIKVNVHSTGYGLYIAKQIVEAHGGNVWAESAGEGTGSRFIVELTAA